MDEIANGNGSVQKYRIQSLEECMAEVKGKLDSLLTGQAEMRESLAVYQASRESTCPLNNRVRALEDWRNYIVGAIGVLSVGFMLFANYLAGKV